MENLFQSSTLNWNLGGKKKNAWLRQESRLGFFSELTWLRKWRGVQDSGTVNILILGQEGQFIIKAKRLVFLALAGVAYNFSYSVFTLFSLYQINKKAPTNGGNSFKQKLHFWNFSLGYGGRWCLHLIAYSILFICWKQFDFLAFTIQ